MVSNLSSSSLKDWPKVKEEVDWRIQGTSQYSFPNMGLVSVRLSSFHISTSVVFQFCVFVSKVKTFAHFPKPVTD